MEGAWNGEETKEAVFLTEVGMGGYRSGSDSREHAHR